MCHRIYQSLQHKLPIGSFMSTLGKKNVLHWADNLKNLFWPSDAMCMARLFEVIECRLFGSKPLPEPMPIYCQLDTNKNKTSMKCGSNYQLFGQESAFENIVNVNNALFRRCWKRHSFKSLTVQQSMKNICLVNWRMLIDTISAIHIFRFHSVWDFVGYFEPLDLVSGNVFKIRNCWRYLKQITSNVVAEHPLLLMSVTPGY